MGFVLKRTGPDASLGKRAGAIANILGNGVEIARELIEPLHARRRHRPFDDLAPIAAAHHERLDGTGYPLKMAADAIGIETRIITVCDFYDALTADRPCRGAMPTEKALGIIEDAIGNQIDGGCYEALAQLVKV